VNIDPFSSFPEFYSLISISLQLARTIGIPAIRITMCRGSLGFPGPTQTLIGGECINLDCQRSPSKLSVTHALRNPCRLLPMPSINHG